MANNTTNPMSHLPTNLLETFIPQYGLIATIVRDVFGFDIGLVMTGALMLYGISTVSQSLYQLAYSLILTKYMASIEFEEHDSIYDYFMDWLQEQRMSKKNHRLTASSSFNEPEGEMLDTTEGYLNFRNWWARNDPNFKPAHGTHWFWHNGRLFEMRRTRREVQSTGYYDTVRQHEEESVTVSCFGRSAAPIKGLLQECKRVFYEKEVSLTSICRPSGAAGSKDWDRVARRRSRPMDTVILDEKEKRKLLDDVNEYLHPKTAVWYSDRGIPYRRGYLFFGPPGTGKTSLSFALAGLFGLNVYCISLLDPQMTEDDLQSLMSDLPSRCVVLLEDIDTAGLAKRKVDDKPKSSKSKSKKSSSDDDDGNDSDDDDSDDKSKRKGISLSGLLNAIDGVASHEGRLLVLTTNCPDKLDAALIRPGRVDMKVGFSLATKQQIRDLFTRMYAGHDDVVDGRLANKFAEQLEEGVWSPAELQGFLLRWKREPSRAVEEVGAWATEERDKKRKDEKDNKDDKGDTAESEKALSWRVPWIAAF